MLPEIDPSWLTPNDPEPEAKLWAAVIELAVDDLASRNELIRLSAWRWLRSDALSVGSFCWVCFELGLDPDHVRAMARRTT